MTDNRLKHSLAVARFMVDIGKSINLNEQQLNELFELGYNHDIGYEFCTNQYEHNIVGANILKSSGYKYWKEVYYHGNPDCEYESMYLDILNKADMQIDSQGNNVGYERRLEDIKQRYKEDSKEYINAKKLIEHLKEKGV